MFGLKPEVPCVHNDFDRADFLSRSMELIFPLYVSGFLNVFDV